MAAGTDLAKRGTAILGVEPRRKRRARHSEQPAGTPNATTYAAPDEPDADGTSTEEKMAALAVKAQQPLIDAQVKLLEAQAAATINPKNPRRIDASAPPSAQNSAASNLASTPGSRIAAMRAADPAWGTMEGRIANEKAVLGPEGGITAAQQATRGARVAAAVGAPAPVPAPPSAAPVTPSSRMLNGGTRAMLPNGSYTVPVPKAVAGPGQLTTDATVAPGAPLGGDQWGPGVGRGINPIRPGTGTSTVGVNGAVRDSVRQSIVQPAPAVAAPPAAIGIQPRMPKPRTGGQSAVVKPRPNPLFRRAA